MAVDLELAPKTKRPAGQPCCEPVVYPDVDREHAVRMAEVAKALGDPIRLQLVDVLKEHADKVCVCELVPLFDISQPTLSHHLKKLRDAGIVDSERRGLWAYYYVLPEALKELSAWLTRPRPAVLPRRSRPAANAPATFARPCARRTPPPRAVRPPRRRPSSRPRPTSTASSARRSTATKRPR